MSREKLSILWFPDCQLSEVHFLSELAHALNDIAPTELIRVPSGGYVNPESLGEVVWIVSHDWKRALRQLHTHLKRKKIFASVLGLPPEKGSLFTLLWRRLFFSDVGRVHLIAHSPINHRFYADIEKWPSRRISYLPFGSFENVNLNSPKSLGSRVVVGAYSRFEPQSNFNYVLSVAHYVLQHRPDTMFRLFGLGPLYAHFIHCVRDFGLESRVEVIECENRTAFENSDIFLFSPVRNDHFQNIVDAASFKLPLVTVDLPGVENYVQDGKTGFVVPQFDTKSMGEIILRLIDNKVLRQSLGQEMAKKAKETFSVEQVSLQFAEKFWGLSSVVQRERAA